MNKIKILILAANPRDTDKLRLDEEIREIEAALERAKSRDRFEIISKLAVRVDDLRRALLDYNPQIVHFSGHGAGANGIALENSAGKVQLVSTASLARLFKLFQSDVQCVFLNACYSEVQAEAMRQHIRYVVGMNKAIGDRAAIEFAKGFYDALGAGRSFEDAYELGCTSIDLESIPEASTPVFKVRSEPGLSSADAEPSPAIAPPPEAPIPPPEALESKEVVEESLEATPVASLEMPEGQVPLDSAFYVERPPIEMDCYETIVRSGSLIRVKAPRQMGKTSLMSRILNHATQQGYLTAVLNFQSADARYLTDLDLCLKWFCANITYELGLDNRLNEFWGDDFLGTKDKCANYFQRYLLKEINQPIALGLDEVDEVFKHPEVAVDFFGLMRAWHERAKNNVTWQKLRMVITHSKEVYIPLNINQSPFNVGLAIDLPVLTQAQVQDLMQRHGLHWSADHLQQLMNLLGGHPYLVRMALYQIARGRVTLEQLKAIAPTEEGPYGDHLRRHVLNLEEDAALLSAAKAVFAARTPVTVGASEAFKLRSMGIVKARGNDVMPLCDLYRQYFCDRLGV